MQFLDQKPKRSFRPLSLGLLVFFLFFLGWFAWRGIDEERKSEVDSIDLFEMTRRFLFQNERDDSLVFLILFQNNTELRPGGGFIGAYAVVSLVSDGPIIEIVEGSERLDARAPDEPTEEPPAPLKHSLGVDRWYFRDSNWSPDFSISAAKALELYTAEGGMLADEIDGVIGVTPTVFEELLKITGPVTAHGLVFDPETGVEKLEYEVEYGYDDRGILPADRKEILRALADDIVTRLLRIAIVKSKEGIRQLVLAGERLIDGKQIVLFIPNVAVREALGIGPKAYEKMSGSVPSQSGDTLLWVDANLGALKTDHAIRRSLAYSISPQAAGHESERGGLLASVSMQYTHTSSFDWRTTRYQTYARVFAPQGSRLVSVLFGGVSIPLDQIDQGEELGRQWFGTFIKIEPETERTLEFIYRLPDRILKSAARDSYTFDVIKQIGVLPYPLTLDLDFGMTTANGASADGAYRRTLTIDKDQRVFVE